MKGATATSEPAPQRTRSPVPDLLFEDTQERRLAEPLTTRSMQQIHDATVRLLGEVGVAMPCNEALMIFQHHGFRVDNGRVFISESQLGKALATTPDLISTPAKLERPFDHRPPVSPRRRPNAPARRPWRIRPG